MPKQTTKHLTLTDLQNNSITVDLKSACTGNKKFTGRMVYNLAEPIEIQINQLDFYCGPEEEDEEYGGALYIQEHQETYDLLRILFADLKDFINIGVAENLHEILPISNIENADLWEVVKNRLERSGAVLRSEYFIFSNVDVEYGDEED